MYDEKASLDQLVVETGQGFTFYSEVGLVQIGCETGMDGQDHQDISQLDSFGEIRLCP